MEFLQSLMLSLFWIAKPSLRVDGPPLQDSGPTVCDGRRQFDPPRLYFILPKLRVGLPFFFSLEL